MRQRGTCIADVLLLEYELSPLLVLMLLELMMQQQWQMLADQ
jgi:hypothetical protein